MKKLILIILCAIFLCGCSISDLTDLLDYDYDEEETTTTTTNTLDKALDDMLVAHYIDVGQGDSIFIELPNDKTMLIDAGESWEADTVIDYIESLGYEKIDYVIGTHPHTDHIGALASVIEHFDIGEIYMPKASSTSKTYENLLTTISDKGLTVKTGKVGVSVIDEDNLSAYMLAPNSDTYSNLNNYSIVLKIIYGDTSFLFTGDAETGSIKEITGNLSADVLKVGHHGSDTSTTEDFLEKVNPKYAIISVGEGNSYGHPADSTLELLSEYTNNVYRTDQNGTVTVTSDGINITVETEK